MNSLFHGQQGTQFGVHSDNVRADGRVPGNVRGEVLGNAHESIGNADSLAPSPCFYLDRYGSSLNGRLQLQIANRDLHSFRLDFSGQNNSNSNDDHIGTLGAEYCRMLSYRVLELHGKIKQNGRVSKLPNSREKALWDELGHCTHVSHGYMLLNTCLALLHERRTSKQNPSKYSVALVFGCTADNEHTQNWIAGYLSHGVSPHIGLIAIVNLDSRGYIESDDWVHMAHDTGDGEFSRFHYQECPHPGLQQDLLPKRPEERDQQVTVGDKSYLDAASAMAVVADALMSFPQLKRRYLNYLEVIVANDSSEDFCTLFRGSDHTKAADKQPPDSVPSKQIIKVARAHEILSVQSLALLRSVFEKLYRRLVNIEERSGRDLIDRILHTMEFHRAVQANSAELQKTFLDRFKEFWKLSPSGYESLDTDEFAVVMPRFDRLVSEVEQYQHDAAEFAHQRDWDNFCLLMYHTFNAFSQSQIEDKEVTDRASRVDNKSFLPTLYKHAIPGIIRNNNVDEFPHEPGSVLHLTRCIEQEETHIATQQFDKILDAPTESSACITDLELITNDILNEEQLLIFHKLHALDAQIVLQASQVSSAARFFIARFHFIVSEFSQSFVSRLDDLLNEYRLPHEFDSELGASASAIGLSQSQIDDVRNAIRRKGKRCVKELCDRLLAKFPLPISQEVTRPEAVADFIEQTGASKDSASPDDIVAAADTQKEKGVGIAENSPKMDDYSNSVHDIIALSVGVAHSIELAGGLFDPEKSALKVDSQTSKLSKDIKATADVLAHKVLGNYKERVRLLKKELKIAAKKGEKRTLAGRKLDIHLPDRQLIDKLALSLSDAEHALNFELLKDDARTQKADSQSTSGDDQQVSVDVLQLLHTHCAPLSKYAIPGALHELIMRESDYFDAHLQVYKVDLARISEICDHISEVTDALVSSYVFLHNALIDGNLTHVDHFCQRWRDKRLAVTRQSDVDGSESRREQTDNSTVNQCFPFMDRLLTFNSVFPAARSEMQGAERLGWFEDLLEYPNKRGSTTRSQLEREACSENTAELCVVHSAALRLFLDVASESELFWHEAGSAAEYAMPVNNEGVVNSVLKNSLISLSQPSFDASVTGANADSNGDASKEGSKASTYAGQDGELMQWMFRADNDVQREIHRLFKSTQENPQVTASNDRFLERLLLKIHERELIVSTGKRSRFGSHWKTAELMFSERGPYSDFGTESPCVASAPRSSSLREPWDLFESINHDQQPFIKVFVCYSSRDGQDLFNTLRTAVEKHNDSIDHDGLSIMLMTDQHLKHTRGWISQLSAGLDVADKVIIISTPWSRMQHVHGKRFIKYFEIERILQRLKAGEKQRPQWGLALNDVKLVTNKSIPLSEWERFYGPIIEEIARTKTMVIADKHTGGGIRTAAIGRATSAPTIDHDMTNLVAELGKNPR